MDAMNLRPEALQLISRIRETRYRGGNVEISASGGSYRLALALKDLGLLGFGVRTVRNHIAYYEVFA